jgi:hypothetical protein
MRPPLAFGPAPWSLNHSGTTPASEVVRAGVGPRGWHEPGDGAGARRPGMALAPGRQAILWLHHGRPTKIVLIAHGFRNFNGFPLHGRQKMIRDRGGTVYPRPLNHPANSVRVGVGPSESAWVAAGFAVGWEHQQARSTNKARTPGLLTHSKRLLTLSTGILSTLKA